MRSIIFMVVVVFVLFYSLTPIKEIIQNNGIPLGNVKANELFVSLGSNDNRSEQCIDEILEKADDYSALWTAKNLGLSACSISYLKTGADFLPVAFESYFRPEMTMLFSEAGISMSANVDTLTCKDAVKMIKVLCPNTVGHATIGW